MSRNTLTITKWVPVEDDTQKELFSECKQVLTKCRSITDLINNFLYCNIKLMQRSSLKEDESVLKTMEEIEVKSEELYKSFKKLYQTFVMNNLEIKNFKIKLWKHFLWKENMKLSYFLHCLLMETSSLFVYCGETFLTIIFKISNTFNNLLTMNNSSENNSLVVRNMCAHLQYPLRKISITKLLQILSHNRAELCCHKLINCLLNNYKYSTLTEEDQSDNSSIEIYRAITRHMSTEKDDSPCITAKETVKINDNFTNIEQLVEAEEEHVLTLLKVAMNVSPLMLGNDSIKKTNTDVKLVSKARSKVLNYYQEVLWGEVSSYLEHVILWWGASPLGAKPPHFSQHLREWILQFSPTDTTVFILSSLTSLADALGMHVMSTSWDQQFRLSSVAARNGNSDTGKLFCDVLFNLVTLSNQCETTTDWILGAPLEELPLVEQIPILHRLDHTIHTTRLWSITDTKRLANNWNVEEFFMITHCDIVNCLSQLNNLKFADHSADLETKKLDVHVQVCASMREKLVSEVKENHRKLKEATAHCINILATICRMVSLANLQMIFPGRGFWREIHTKPPELPNSYVHKYLDEILSPVLEATEDLKISNMILQIMCEAWLDHIYIAKIKFSHFGALQLLKDFAYVHTWLLNCPVISLEVRQSMTKNEVLRKCEGVGRLLLRNPGEQLKMNGEKKIGSSGKNGELMPPEMYVPNQEQWLELRLHRKKALLIGSICCGVK